MKNVSEYSLKTCIFLDEDELDIVIKSIFGDSARVSLDEGMTVYYGNTDCVESEELYKKLAEYFDVSKITSTHVDDCSYCIWIVYEE